MRTGSGHHQQQVFTNPASRCQNTPPDPHTLLPRTLLSNRLEEVGPYSYFPNITVDWTSMPEDVATALTLESFQS